MDRKVNIEMYRLGVYFRRDKKGQRWLDEGQTWIESYEFQSIGFLVDCKKDRKGQR